MRPEITHCRSCACAIRFIETPQGKYLPVDPDLVKTYVRPGKGLGRVITLVQEDGQTLSRIECSFTEPGAIAVEGYISHFATCSDPARWRRPTPR